MTEYDKIYQRNWW